MTVLKIYDLDDAEENLPLSTFSEGKHVIGREKLNCKDKRISRSHALLVIADEAVSLKSTHINPSFYKPKNGNSIQLVKQDEIVTLTDGDQFALLPDKFWFKVKIEEIPNGSLKRTADDSFDSNKKLKLSEDTSFNSPEKTNSEDSVTADIENDKTTLQNKNIEDTSTNLIESHSETGPQTSNSERIQTVFEQDIADENDHLNNDLVDKKVQTQDSTKLMDPSTSQLKTRRDRCWYGDKCYRKNPSHKIDFSHPGDDDYNTDPEDDRPVCPFGDTCYRTNFRHRKQYKHSKPPVAKPKLIRTGSNTNIDNSDTDDQNEDQFGRKRRKAAAKPKRYAETPEDDYDIDDPFINDASSDDFQISEDEDDDSDWEDSQEVNEESQDTRRLLKEAKKFTKKKQ